MVQDIILNIKSEYINALFGIYFKFSVLFFFFYYVYTILPYKIITQGHFDTLSLIMRDGGNIGFRTIII